MLIYARIPSPGPPQSPNQCVRAGLQHQKEADTRTLVIPSSVATAEQHGETLTSEKRAGSSVSESKEELSERISVLPT